MAEEAASLDTRFEKLSAVDERELSPADTASSEEEEDSSSSSVAVQLKQQLQATTDKEDKTPELSSSDDNQLTHDDSADTAKSAIAIAKLPETVEAASNQQEQAEAHASEVCADSSSNNDAAGVEDPSETDDEEALDRRMTYIGEGLLDVGSMDAIDRLSDVSSYSGLETLTGAGTGEDEKTPLDVTRHMSVDENHELPSDPAQAAVSQTTANDAAAVEDSKRVVAAASPATNKLQAFLSKGSEQKPAAPPVPAASAPAPQPAVRRPLPPPPPPQPAQAAATASVSTKKPHQLPTVSIENRRSKLLDFLANDVGERYLDGVYQEEARDELYESTDDEMEVEAPKTEREEQEQEAGRQRRTKRANSKLLAFLAKERGERLHKVERGSEDASAQRLSTTSETSSTTHSQPKNGSKLLDFVAKVVPEKPKLVIFDPADALSETEELEHLVAEQAQKKRQKREEREKARQKVLAFLAEEEVHGKPAGSTVTSVDETKVQREKVVDRYGREGLLDFLDRTEAAQQQRIRWATSRNSGSSRSGSSSPSSSATSSPKSTLVPPSPPTMPPASSSSVQRAAGGAAVVAAAKSSLSPPPPPPSSVPAPSRPAPNAGNRLASFLSKITTRASPAPAPSSANRGEQTRGSPQMPPRHGSPKPAAQPAQPAKPVAAPSIAAAAPASPSVASPPPRNEDSAAATTTVTVTDSADASAKSLLPSAKMQPVLTALSQISQTCAANELNDVAIARITTLLSSISQIVKDDLQKGSSSKPIRRWSNASSASPSWVKSGKEIEEFDKKHAAVAVKSSSAVIEEPQLQSNNTPAVLERNSELKVTVASTVLQSFNAFEGAQNLLEVVATFHKLLADCGLTDLKLLQPWAVYDHVKSAVASKLGFRQKQLFKLLDAKFSGEAYSKKPAARKRVCIIGAGPVGLRAAVEMALLGAQVVVLEKRKHFSRENILHLWPWVVQDLTSLGAKVLFPQFCHSTAYFHVGTRQLQCILLKVALLLGVTFFPATAFEGIAHPDSLDSGRRPFYTVLTKPQIPWMEFTAVLGACGTQDKLSEQARIKRFVFSRKEAIGLVCYFPNHGTAEEKNVAEFSWTIQFKQQMFAKMRDVGVDLENIVYYRGEMHYLVMTPKRQNLLDQGVLKQDYPNVADLVLDDNIDKPVLHEYLKRVVDFVKIPQKSEFARVRIFDFSSRTRADKAASILTSKGKKLYVGLIGDSLMEPFWPEGLGTCRGFLSALDGCWMVAQVGFRSDEQLLADRELAYRVIQHVSGFRRDDLHKNVRKYSVDPKTRYVVKFPQLC